MPNDPSKDTDEFTVSPSSPGATTPFPTASRVRVDVAALTHTGHVRPNNEDVYLVARAGRVLEPLLTNLPTGVLPDRFEDLAYGLLVADGLGGNAAGEVASRLAVRTVIRLVLETPDWVMRSGEREGERLLQRMSERYQVVDEVVRAESETDPGLVGMGSTMTLAASLDADLFVGHVGDSRAYLYRGGQLHQLTRDHTYAQDLLDRGILRPDEAASHRFRHILTRALGGGDRASGGPEADVQRIRLSDADQVLLCTDGLTEMVENAAIRAVLRESGTAQDACQELVALALKNGGKDNVTVVLARYRFTLEP